MSEAATVVVGGHPIRKPGVSHAPHRRPTTATVRSCDAVCMPPQAHARFGAREGETPTESRDPWCPTVPARGRLWRGHSRCDTKSPQLCTTTPKQCATHRAKHDEVFDWRTARRREKHLRRAGESEASPALHSFRCQLTHTPHPPRRRNRAICDAVATFSPAVPFWSRPFAEALSVSPPRWPHSQHR